MTDPNDKVTRSYRELAREEPSTALDSAILAASRRAIAPASAARRWGPPVSIAAVLMLAVGVSLHMQREEPGVEYAQPARPAPAAPAPEAPAPVTQEPVQKLERRDVTPAARPQSAAPGASKRAETFAAQDVKSKRLAPSVDAAVEEKPAAKKDAAFADNAAARPMFVPEPAAPASQPAPASPPVLVSPPVPARAAPSGAAATSLAKTRDALESRQASTLQAPASVAARAKTEAETQEKGARELIAQLTPEQELERIARLRAEGRGAEADKALEEFRRKHPDFRIPEAMWQRVKPSPKGEGDMPR